MYVYTKYTTDSITCIAPRFIVGAVLFSESYDVIVMIWTDIEYVWYWDWDWDWDWGRDWDWNWDWNRDMRVIFRVKLRWRHTIFVRGSTATLYRSVSRATLLVPPPPIRVAVWCCIYIFFLSWENRCAAFFFWIFRLAFVLFGSKPSPNLQQRMMENMQQNAATRIPLGARRQRKR